MYSMRTKGESRVWNLEGDMDRTSTSRSQLSTWLGGRDSNMVSDRSLQHLILQVFEEEDENFFFPLTSQKQARAFVRSLHTKGIEYKDLCEEIGEFEHNFVSWRKGVGRPGIGNRIIELINRPLQEILLSDGEEDEEDEEEDVVPTQTNGKTYTNKPAYTENKPLQGNITNSWVSNIDKKIQDLELAADKMASEMTAERVSEDKDTEAVSEVSGEDASSSSPASSSETGGESDDERDTQSEDLLQQPSSSSQSPAEATGAPAAVPDVSDQEETAEVAGDEKITPSPVTESHQDAEGNTDDTIPTVITENVSVSFNLAEVEDATSPCIAQQDAVAEENLSVTAYLDEGGFKQRASSDGGFISSEASSIAELEISENYDSDLDIDAIDRESDMSALVKRIQSKKAEVTDGKGFVYIFTDSATTATMHRVKIGASRFPNRRLEQAIHYNVDIQLVSATPVDDRRAAMREIHQRLHRLKVKCHEDWFQGPMEQIQKVVTEVSERFSGCNTDC